MNNIYDTVIIGGGPAGLTAGLYTARARLKVALLEKAGCGGQVLMANVIENYPGFPAKQQKYEKILFAFMKRLPPRSRGDFGKYLDALRIPNNAEISDFALLGYSGAKLPDDGFTVIHTFENAVPPFEFLLNVQGYRYYAEQVPSDRIELGQEATFQAEPENKSDPKAIKVIIGGTHADYVCRGLTDSFHRWFAADYKITASIERINGTTDRPDIYLFVSVKNVG